MGRLSLLVLVLSIAYSQSDVVFPGEKRLKNIKQLTFTGENAEAYFSFDDNFLTLQATGYGADCDQIYRYDLTKEPHEQILNRLSTGLGSCTCSFFYPNNRDILYAGNFHKVHMNATLGSKDGTCPGKKCESAEAKTDTKLQQLCNTSYTWDIYPDYDIFKANEYGMIMEQLTKNEVYDAEGVINPQGTQILYTSLLSGDLELWLMDLDGRNAHQITNELGYDGGAFFSPKGDKIVYRASRPKTDEEIQKYKDLLSYNLVAPTEMELWVMNADGTNRRPVFATPLGGANWAPYYLPDNERIIFSSNFNSTSDDFNSFDLYIVHENGTGLERITFDDGYFDSFPMFSRSGKKLVWGSSRNHSPQEPYEIDIFIADWVDDADLAVAEEEERERSEALATNRVGAMRRVPKQKTKKSSKKSKTQKRWQDLETVPFDGEIHFPEEVHLKNVKQLTFGGENAEGYFSFDDNKLTLQATGYGTDCDQIFELDLNIDPKQQIMRRVSTGLGVTTCSFFFKESDNNDRLYAGTFWNVTASDYADASKTCPAKKCGNPDLITDPVLKDLCNTSYTWDIYSDFDIFKVNQYGNIVQQLTDTPGYDAEGVLSPDGKLIAFTSIRTGDLELWIMNSDGSNQRQITNELGYDGGAFFSPDGKRLVFRASRPNTTEDIAKYKKLLEYDLVEPVAMELFVVDIDGTNMRQITNLGQANWAPYYLHDNKRIIFSSNYFDAANGFGAFALFVINDDGTGLERVTYGDSYQFDSFAMMNYAGTKLVWGSSRNAVQEYDLNLFIADWVDPQPDPSPPTACPTSPPSSSAPNTVPQSSSPKMTTTSKAPAPPTTTSFCDAQNLLAAITVAFLADVLAP